MRQLYSPVQSRPQTVVTPSTPHPQPSSIPNVHLAMNGSIPNIPLPMWFRRTRESWWDRLYSALDSTTPETTWTGMQYRSHISWVMRDSCQSSADQTVSVNVNVVVACENTSWLNGWSVSWSDRCNGTRNWCRQHSLLEPLAQTNWLFDFAALHANLACKTAKSTPTPEDNNWFQVVDLWFCERSNESRRAEVRGVECGKWELGLEESGERCKKFPLRINWRVCGVLITVYELSCTYGYSRT